MNIKPTQFEMKSPSAVFNEFITFSPHEIKILTYADGNPYDIWWLLNERLGAVGAYFYFINEYLIDASPELLEKKDENMCKLLKLFPTIKEQMNGIPREFDKHEGNLVRFFTSAQMSEKAEPNLKQFGPLPKESLTMNQQQIVDVFLNLKVFSEMTKQKLDVISAEFDKIPANLSNPKSLLKIYKAAMSQVSLICEEGRKYQTLWQDRFKGEIQEARP